MWALMFFSLLLFPTGRLPSPRWRPVAWALAGFFTLATVLLVIKPGPFVGTIVREPNPAGIEAAASIAEVGLNTVIPIFSTVVLAVPASVLVRFWYARGEERQQLKWLAYTAGLWLVVSGISELTRFVLPNPMIDHVDNVLYMIAVAPIPAAVGIAVLRYRLYDIDFIINRTLVYGTLTACVVGIYVLVVGYLGATFRTGGNLAVSLVATGVVAVLFAPLRDRLQRAVNRLLYGERDEPYAVLSRLGQRLEATISPGAVLSTVVETIAEALKLPYAAVEIERNGAFETEAATGERVEDPLRLPLVYGGETVGRLVLGPRTGNADFTPADRRLLEDLARQIGAAVHATRLSGDLQRSRERLVTARE